MITRAPDKVKKGESITAEAWNKLVDHLHGLTPWSGTNVRLKYTPDGVIFSSYASSAASADYAPYVLGASDWGSQRKGSLGYGGSKSQPYQRLYYDDINQTDIWLKQRRPLNGRIDPYFVTGLLDRGDGSWIDATSDVKFEHLQGAETQGVYGFLSRNYVRLDNSGYYPLRHVSRSVGFKEDGTLTRIGTEVLSPRAHPAATFAVEQTFYDDVSDLPPITASADMYVLGSMVYGSSQSHPDDSVAGKKMWGGSTDKNLAPYNETARTDTWEVDKQPHDQYNKPCYGVKLITERTYVEQSSGSPPVPPVGSFRRHTFRRVAEFDAQGLLCRIGPEVKIEDDTTSGTASLNGGGL